MNWYRPVADEVLAWTSVMKLDSLSATAISSTGSVFTVTAARTMVWTRWRRIFIGPKASTSLGSPPELAEIRSS